MKQINLFGTEFSPDSGNKYTAKIEAPFYEPKNKKPHLLELLDKSKTKKMNKTKYFKVKEMVNREGKTIYKVLGAESKFDVFLGIWTSYSYENETLDEAVEHIQLLYKLGLKSEKTVYKTDINTLSANGS